MKIVCVVMLCCLLDAGSTSPNIAGGSCGSSNTNCIPSGRPPGRECPVGFYKYNTTTCHKCSRGCVRCSSRDSCEECNDIGYYKNNNGTCDACTAGCYHCSSRSMCTVCNRDGYYKDIIPGGSKCKPCRKHCTKCHEHWACTACEDGYYRQTDYSGKSFCRQCRTHCKLCSSSRHCIECQTGYSGKTCSLCSSGFYGSAKQCEPCPTLCTNCTSNTTCTACTPGYALLNDQQGMNGTTCEEENRFVLATVLPVIIGVVSGVVVAGVVLVVVVVCVVRIRRRTRSGQTTSAEASLSEYVELIDTRPDEPVTFHLTTEILGKGATSVVVKGRFNDVDVAIKRVHRIDPQDSAKVEREQKILRELDRWSHPNIIQLKYAQVQGPFLYLVLELCDGTLDTYINNAVWREAISPSDVNRQMAAGLHYLHANGIVHRDIKPSNVLFRLKQNTVIKVCFSDFGMAKHSTDGMYSATGAIGTVGFMAPELCDDQGQTIDEKCDNRSDIFSQGILFSFTITGKHPFGKSFYEQQPNIIKGEKSLEELYAANLPWGSLVQNMLEMNPNERPNAEQVCVHPAMWTDEYIMSFYMTVSDALHADKSIHNLVEHPALIPNRDWMTRLPTNLQQYLRNLKRPSYSGREWSVVYLLRAIRNTAHHVNEYSDGAQRDLGKFPEGHVAVWKACCPKLLMHVWGRLKYMRKKWNYENKTLESI